jgi:hypothetical protein
VQSWIEEEVDGLPMATGDFLAATEERIAVWNEHGRQLCTAFLAATSV